MTTYTTRTPQDKKQELGALLLDIYEAFHGMQDYPRVLELCAKALRLVKDTDFTESQRHFASGRIIDIIRATYEVLSEERSAEE